MKRLLILILALCSAAFAAQSLTVIYHRDRKMANVEIDGRHYLTTFQPADTNDSVLQRILSLPEPNEPNEQMQISVDEAIDVILNSDLTKEDSEKLESLNTKVDSAITTKTQEDIGVIDAK